MNTGDYERIEQAIDQWRQNRLFVAVGCGEAERQAFAAGYRAGAEFNVLRNTPIDDEPETDQERAAVAEARADIQAGRTRTWAEFNAARRLLPDEEGAALERFRSL